MPSMMFGVDSFGLSRWEDAISTLVKMQGEGAFALQQGGVRYAELEAWALIFAVGVAALDAAEANANPTRAFELLTEWEAAFHVPNVGGDTVAARQQRLVALRQIGGSPLAADVGAALVSMGLVPGVDVQHNRRAQVAINGSLAEAIYQVTLRSDSFSSRAKIFAEWLLKRTLPPRFGQLDGRIADMLVTGSGMFWNDTVQPWFAAIVDPGNYTLERPPARAHDYTFSSAMTPSDIVEVQRRVLLAASKTIKQDVAAGVSFSPSWFAVSVGIGATAELHTADVRKRLIRITWIETVADTRPGIAGDTGLNAGTVRTAVFYTGTGGLGTGYDYVSPSGVTFYSDNAAAGKLKLKNASATLTSMVGVFEISADCTVGTIGGTPLVVNPYDGLGRPQPASASGLNAAGWTQLRNALGQSAADGAGVDAWTGFAKRATSATTGWGGAVRVFAVGASLRAGVGATTAVLDASMDWTDRLLWVIPMQAGGATTAPYFPGGASDAQSGLTPTFGYTGTGVATGLAALQNYHIPVGAFRLGANTQGADAGSLVLEHATGSATVSAAITMLVFVSDQLGKRGGRSTPIALPAVPVDGNEVHPAELTWLQDVSVAIQSQARSGDEAWLFGGGLPSRALDARVLPLGKRLRARLPRIAESYQVRRGESWKGTVQRAQRGTLASGRIRRVFGDTITNLGISTIDASEDWRDRLLTIWVSVAGLVIYPGGASDSTFNASVQTPITFYTANDGREIQVGATGMFVSASLAGALTIRNAAGATRTISGWAEASFALGPRSV